MTWAGQRFETRAEFEAWLNARGLSYVAWAQRHAEAARRLEK